MPEIREIPDSELLMRCLTNEDAAAWDMFVRRYSRLIWSSIHRAFRATSFSYTSEDAEDVFSAIFLSLLEYDCRKLRQFQSRNSCKLSTWLAVVSVNRTIDHMRGLRRGTISSLEDLERLSESLADTRYDIESLLIEEQQGDALDSRLASLTGDDRAMFDLVYVKDLKPEAAAEQLGISLAAFYTRKHRLVEKIKKTMSPL